MVDHLSFRRFISGLNLDFEMISRDTLRTDIFEMFDNEKSTLKELLKVNQDRVVMTTNLSIASKQKKGCMAMLAHFVDDDLIFQNCTLRYIYLHLIIIWFHDVRLIMFL